jgi:hypothetical protein
MNALWQKAWILFATGGADGSALGRVQSTETGTTREPTKEAGTTRERMKKRGDSSFGAAIVCAKINPTDI